MARLEQLCIPGCDHHGCEQPSEFKLINGRGLVMGFFCEPCGRARLTTQQITEDRRRREAIDDLQNRPKGRR